MSTSISRSYFPNYFSFDDIYVTQERVPCLVKTCIPRIGFLDQGSDSSDLEPGKVINLPLWYINEISPNNPYFSVELPPMYKSIHKAICEANSTHIELGKLHPYFYEFGRYLTNYDHNNVTGQIVYETCRQRVRLLLEIAKNVDDLKHGLTLENLENELYESGVKTSNLFTNWLQYKKSNIMTSALVEDYTKKRKRDLSDADSAKKSIKM